MGWASRCDNTRRALCATFLPVMLGLAAGLGPAAAQKVGVAAAVNPDAFTSRGGQLDIGKSIFFNERISTTGSGLVQVLLVDGSTFTVGPGSDLVIDKFVYNPKKETGEVVATFSKGAMRYVGGKISKNEDGVTIKTPNGSLAVRGGMVQGIVAGPKILISLLFGKEMVFTALNGKTYTVFQPGYTLDLSGGVVKIRPTTAADIAKVMALLTNGDTSAIGQSDDEQGEGTDAVTQLANISDEMADLIDEATANQIQAALQAQMLEFLSKSKPTPPTQPTPTVTEHFSGYAAITLTSISHPEFADMLLGISPEEFALAFNSGTLLGHTNFTVHDLLDLDPAADTYHFSIPIGPTMPGYSGNISTQVILNGAPVPHVNANGSFFIGNPQGGAAICSKCDFMKWGGVGMRIVMGPGENPTEYDDVLVGFWVAGDLPTVAQLPSSGSATYTGNTLGIVAHRPHNEAAWATRPASGNVSMTWNFANRAGNLAITNFDGAHNFSGTMNMSGPNSAVNRFQGDLGGSLSGAAYGSFARKGSDPAAGVLGNWAAQNNLSTYRGTGVFGAAR